MKKKNLKSLSLNKMTISNLHQLYVHGGKELIADETDTCITTVQSGEVPKPSCGSC